MKTVFLTDGGERVGFGHITRCSALAQVLKENGTEVSLIINGDDSVESVLSGEDYQILDWMKNPDRTFSLIKDFDLVVIDSYQVDDNFCKGLADLPARFICMQTNDAVHYPPGIIVKESLYAQELQDRDKEGSMYLYGPQYAMLRKAFEHSEKEIKEDVKSIMVTVGGQDEQGLTPRIMEFLKQDYPELKTNIIVGGRFDNIDEIEKLADEQTHLIHSPNAESMKKIMQESDLAISAGGQTLYELARVGVPTVGICLVECQEKNVQSWAEVGFVEYAGWHNDPDLFKNLKVAMDRTMPYEKRVKRSAIGQRYVDGKGAQRIIEKALSI